MTASDESERNTPSRLARALFASGLAVLAIRNLTDLDGRIAYAEAKGVPEADRLVPAASGLLLGGSIGIGLWKLPKLASASVAAFFAGVTPTMHDFWAVDDDARDQELTSFLQNVTLLGAAVVFVDWATGA